MTRKLSTHVILRHPEYGDRTITQTQYNLLQAAAESYDIRTTKLAQQLHLSEGTINNAFSHIIGELQVANRAAAVSWFKASEIVNSHDLIDRQPLLEDISTSVLNELRFHQQSLTIAFVTAYLFFSLIIFGYILVFHAKHSLMNAWSNLYSVIPLIGGLMGGWVVRKARRITDSYYYLPVQFICLGMIFWSIGGLIWVYYNLIEKIEVPYPAIPDWVGYLPAALFIFFGYLLLHKRSTKDWLVQLILVAIVGFVFGFAIFIYMWYLRGWLFIATKDPGKILLDIGYPIFDLVSLLFLSLTRIVGSQELSSPKLKPTLKWLTLGMILYLIADISFGATTTLSDDNIWQYFPGNQTDFIFMTAFFVLSLAIIQIPIQKRHDTTQSKE